MDDARNPLTPPFQQMPPSGGVPELVHPRVVRYSRLPGMLLVLGLLIGLLIMPSIVEDVEYRLTRGRERAEAEVAGELLANNPDAGTRIPYVVKKIEPSVVAVETIQIAGGSMTDERSLLDGGSNVRGGIGSGVIMDTAGYVVTNYHVIAHAAQVTVTLADGRSVPAALVGADPAADLAVLKIEAGNLVAAQWGDSGKLEVGDPVLAIGSPFGLSQTVTSGIVSAKERRGMVENARYGDFLQTDAAVNPGNSGGPLVNMNGQVVGINTAIVGPTYRGISFAIPSRLVQAAYEQLKTSGGKIVARGWLGVGLVDVNGLIAERLGLAEARGAFITTVYPGSPADQAGIKKGDVILQWNKEPVDTSTDLRLLVLRSKMGAKATVAVVRDGKTLDLTVTIGARPEGKE